ncbi:ssDNA-binding protein [Marinilactibacillus piezotolerans]|uniref:ssDNA-binding protein n=1 Tax=Marinilactibacillus piezotolerans TaxID=258723 RepID=UPI0009B0C6C5|nr:ssDNA-binding protein [Marinilactibacillus piezotolerans]
MEVVIVEGIITSEEIKVLKTDNGIPLCRFTLNTNGKNINCLISGKKAYSFLYEAEKDTILSITGKINHKDQLVVIRYIVLKKPTYFGKIFNYKGHPLPFAKT